MTRFFLLCFVCLLGSWAWGQELPELQSTMEQLEAQAATLDQLAMEADQKDRMLLELSQKITDFNLKLQAYKQEKQNESNERQKDLEALSIRSEALNEQVIRWQAIAEVWVKNYGSLLKISAKQQKALNFTSTVAWAAGTVAVLAGIVLGLDVAGVIEL